MARMRLMLLGMAVGMLAGCTAAADPSAGGGVTPAAPAASLPNVITPGDTAAPADSADGQPMPQFTSSPVAGLPQCNQYSATPTVDGKPQPVNGEACQQPDGSWHIAEQPAGSTVVYQTVYWPPAGASAYTACFDNSYDYPCLYAFPFGFSVGFPVFIDIHHHFHHFVHDGQFHHFGPVGHFGPIDHFSHAGAFRGGSHEGFHDGFHDGFHGGFHDGIHGGFHGGFHESFHGGFAGGGLHH
jgi:hypothetical protein